MENKVLSPEDVGEIRIKTPMPQLCIFCEHFDARVDEEEAPATAHCAKEHYPITTGRLPSKGITLNDEDDVRDAALRGLNCPDYIQLVNLDDIVMRSSPPCGF